MKKALGILLGGVLGLLALKAIVVGIVLLALFLPGLSKARAALPQDGPCMMCCCFNSHNEHFDVTACDYRCRLTAGNTTRAVEAFPWLMRFKSVREMYRYGRSMCQDSCLAHEARSR